MLKVNIGHTAVSPGCSLIKRRLLMPELMHSLLEGQIMALGEAVLFANTQIAVNIKYIRKQTTQLATQEYIEGFMKVIKGLLK